MSKKEVGSDAKITLLKQVRDILFHMTLNSVLLMKSKERKSTNISDTVCYTPVVVLL